jgi:D-glutamate cyclase
MSKDIRAEVAPIAAAFENLDRLLNVEMRPQGLPVGVIRRLYQEARRNGPPLVWQAAEALRKRGQRVACVTGCVFTHLPRGEVDGPIGAAVLAQSLVRLGRRADVIVPMAMVPIVESVRAVLQSDFGIVTDEKALTGDYDSAITVERLGRNRKGRTHSIFGAPLEQEPTADEFIESLNKAGRLTIGIGDGGNEIGFGALYDFAREVVPNGSACGCPCGDGLVTSTATEIIVPCNVSDFGAYAITAALGVLEGLPLLLPSAETVAKSIEAAVALGCLEGGSFLPGEMGDDGIPIAGVMAMVTLMRTVATQHFRATPRHA